MSFANRLGTVANPKREDHRPRVLRGVTDIDDSLQTESTAFMLLSVKPRPGAVVNSAKVILDLDKATTGLGSVETSVTLNFQIGRKVDGTNWRLSQVALPAALSGTLAAGDRSAEIDLGGFTEETRIYAVASGDVTADMEIPFEVIYQSTHEPVITAVAAG